MCPCSARSHCEQFGYCWGGWPRAGSMVAGGQWDCFSATKAHDADTEVLLGMGLGSSPEHVMRMKED